MAETNKIAVDAVCAQFVHVRFITAFCGGGTGCVPTLQRGGGGHRRCREHGCAEN
jgi:hypothetical protein